MVFVENDGVVGEFFVMDEIGRMVVVGKLKDEFECVE